MNERKKEEIIKYRSNDEKRWKERNNQWNNKEWMIRLNEWMKGR